MDTQAREASIDIVRCSAYTVPGDKPEADAIGPRQAPRFPGSHSAGANRST
jgi:hypothetical protein